MKQKMSDGYDWRWRYTFVNDTPAALLLHCDLRARRTSEECHRRLGMGLIRCQRAVGAQAPHYNGRPLG